MLSCSKSYEQDENFNSLIRKSDYSVIMFFAPDCPLCMTYSKPFNALTSQYKDVQFIAVQSGEYYEAMEIQMFAIETKLQAPIYRDYDYAVAHELNAEITPQFFLIDKEGNVLYKGLLDDRMEQLGVNKQHWNKHFLRDAIVATKAGKDLKVSETNAIGCVLEY